ncbi:hypothetical protein LQ948_15870 [Jiella sp. MQZ9-1]|uniref:hypothetical protein n=1 Tax=Jiella flava TaxID=2816857 RepID=UPI001E3AFD9B|nr:hypothetical protein [Jiella flava]MCD2472683.1 hypothetical protein [Jiella flava]
MQPLAIVSAAKATPRNDHRNPDCDFEVPRADAIDAIDAPPVLTATVNLPLQSYEYTN